MHSVQTNSCPTCNGEKIIPGVCECDSEWRGTETDNEWADCHCTPDVECPTCNGTEPVGVES